MAVAISLFVAMAVAITVDDEQVRALSAENARLRAELESVRLGAGECEGCSCTAPNTSQFFLTEATQVSSGYRLRRDQPTFDASACFTDRPAWPSKRNGTSGSQTKEAYAWTIFGDDFVAGAMVSGFSIRKHLSADATRDLLCFYRRGALSALALAQLALVFDRLIPMEPFPMTPEVAKKAEEAIPSRLGGAQIFDKFAVWKQTAYSRIAVLDADTFAMSSLDELFQLEPGFYAVAENHALPSRVAGVPLNSGFLLIEPSLEVYAKLARATTVQPGMHAGDQVNYP
jgi:hypothetical protein